MCLILWDVASGLPVCDFIETGENEIRLTSAGDRIIFVNGFPQLSELLLPPNTPPPPWLAERAIAAGGWKMLDGGSLERVPSPHPLWLQSNQEASKNNSPWQKFQYQLQKTNGF